MHPTIDRPRTAQPAAAETLRKTARGYYLRSTRTNMGFNPVPATITLTDQRLVIKPERPGISLAGLTFAALGIFQPVAFPLRHIRSVVVHDKTVWNKRDVLRLEFDSDGREYLWVQPAYEWQVALLTARAAAGDLPYSTLPAIRNGVEASPTKSAGKLLLLMLGLVMALVLACTIIGVLLPTTR